MPTRPSLADRQARLDQQRARLQQEERRLRDAERKARTRRLVEAGALLDKAGLLDLDANALYGALRSLAPRLDDPSQVEAWAKAGGQAFDREAKARDAGKEPFVLAVDTALPASVTARLRDAGFRWSRVMRHWEGLALPDDARALAAELGASLRPVAPPDAATEAEPVPHRDPAVTPAS